MIDQELKKLFYEFEKAFDALDFEKMAALYTDSFMSAGPTGIIARSKAEFLREAGVASEFYRSIGQTSARIISLDEIPINEQYSLVNVHWGVMFRKTGDTPVEFDVSYIVYKVGAEPRIVLFIAHQDEQKAMRELGLSQVVTALGPNVTITPSEVLGEAPFEIGELAAENYSSAEGYDPNFLGADHQLELPKLAPHLQAKVAQLKDGGEVLTYHHFSIVMNAERRLAFHTAVNVDGRQLTQIKRGSDKWYFDPRLDKQLQAGPELYANNPLDLGHLVRRLDPCWGSIAVAAGEDTFHFTNCSPQHSKLNQRDWLEVENYVLNTADNADVRISVFTGPVFRDDDMLYRGEYQLPADFWKIVAFINKNGQLRATAYLRSQKNYLESLEFFDDDYKTWQVPVAQVEALQAYLSEYRRMPIQWQGWELA
jgi:DNA/RNA endonuclease G (NUC1)